jgi:hypothetical protein
MRWWPHTQHARNRGWLRGGCHPHAHRPPAEKRTASAFTVVAAPPPGSCLNAASAAVRRQGRGTAWPAPSARTDAPKECQIAGAVDVIGVCPRAQQRLGALEPDGGGLIEVARGRGAAGARGWGCALPGARCAPFCAAGHQLAPTPAAVRRHHQGGVALGALVGGRKHKVDVGAWLAAVFVKG